MNELFDYIRKTVTSPLQCIVVVGAGTGTDLTVLRSMACSRLILVEPQPLLATELSRQIRRDQGEEVHCLALTDHDIPQAELHVCNNGRYSSLAPIGELTRQLPNLCAVDHVLVPAMSLHAFLATIDPGASDNNVLILDAPGLNAKLIRATPPDTLLAFSWIMLQGASIPGLFRDDLTVNETGHLLENIGFEVVQHDAHALYPHAGSLLRRNDLLVKIFHLQTALHTRTKERDTLAAEKSKLLLDLDKTRRQLQRRDDRIVQLEESSAGMRSQQLMLKEELIKAEAQIELIKELLLQDAKLSPPSPMSLQCK